MRADILMARKEYDLAIASYQEILKNEPKNAILLNKIGIAYEDLGNADQAEHFYRKSMAADKHFPIPVNNFGTLEYATATLRQGDQAISEGGQPAYG